MGTDPYRLEVFRNQVASVAEEMGAALHRTAFSPNIKERRDHSCAVFDPSGRLVAQAEHIPVHLGAMAETVRVVLQRFEPAPGDLVILNDPFLGGTHLPDLSMVSPVYHRDRMVALLASRAHHSDIGGHAPGSLAITEEIFQEGLIIPPVLLRRGGRHDGSVEDIICANTRNPVERRGDLEAQSGAHAVGRRRLLSLVEKMGADGFESACGDLMDYSERLARLSLGDIPPGRYVFEDFLDDDGFSSKPIAVKVSVTVEGDSALVDYEGTSPAVEGPLNCPASVTLSATYYVFRCVAGDGVPANDGAFRPLEVRIPEGCLLDARKPYAVAGGNVETSQRVVDVLLGAFARALPDRIPAASYGTMSNLAIGSGPGTRGAPFSYYETIAGGTGGHPAAPGKSGTHAHMTNTLNTPVEALEHAYPLRVTEYRVRRRSGGAGQHRGGDGLIREIEVLDDCRATILSDRRNTAPYGLKGGSPGKPGRDLLITEQGRRVLPSKCNLKMRAGDRIRISTPGGGGWGERKRR